MKYNILRLILLAAISFQVASCATHKKQPQYTLIRPQPRHKDF